MEEKLRAQQEELKQRVLGSDNVVFFGGAGVSTESGIPDFRSADGIFNKQYAYRPEEIVSHSFFESNCGEFYRFYKENMIFREAKPNAAHLKLAELEAQGILKAVITQNVDGLHQMAGCKHVIELHGSVRRNYCMVCGEPYDVEFITGSEGVPFCAVCGGVVRPDVVLYEEPLDERVIKRAIRAISGAEILIVAGTSLSVYPAAGFLDYFRGSLLAIINRTPTPLDRQADLVLEGSVGEVLDW
jgi:NAD-dependent deacetylase